MTEKDFIKSFLNVSEEDYEKLLINPRMMEEMLDAYITHVEKNKTDATPKPIRYENGYGLSTNSATQELHRRQNERFFTNDTQEPYK